MLKHSNSVQLSGNVLEFDFVQRASTDRVSRVFLYRGTYD